VSFRKGAVLSSRVCLKKKLERAPPARIQSLGDGPRRGLHGRHLTYPRDLPCTRTARILQHRPAPLALAGVERADLSHHRQVGAGAPLGMSVASRFRPDPGESSD
jgi:hypothetical protein